jgi:phosphatidylglycerophosphatase A
MPSTDHQEDPDLSTAREPTPGRDDGQQLSFLTRLIATGLFSGYIPWASGTFGSIVGVLLYLIPGVERTGILIILIVAGFVAGVITSAKVALVDGHRLTKTAEFAKATFQPGAHDVPDPSIVVIDEIVGMWITLLFLPVSIPTVVVAFFAFRGFDIIKPPPARQLEKIPNGWGIMLDDVVAGIYANIATRIALVVLHGILPSFS